MIADDVEFRRASRAIEELFRRNGMRVRVRRPRVEQPPVDRDEWPTILAPEPEARLRVAFTVHGEILELCVDGEVDC